MAILTYQEYYPFVLKALESGKLLRLSEIQEIVADDSGISEEDRMILLPSKTQSVFVNRVNWACFYLKKAGVLSTPQRGHYQLTTDGEKVIRENGYAITNDVLMQFDSFRELVTPNTEKIKGTNQTEIQEKENDDETPEDKISVAVETLNRQLADSLLDQIQKMSPVFFEKLVLDLLFAMGYGGRKAERVLHTKSSNDEGIDGIINEDELGFDAIYVQAKKWINPVSRPEVQKFSGALAGQDAKKGVFITTSTFSSGAIDYAKRLHQPIILIDGQKLTSLMIAYGVGCTIESEIKIQRIDKDYFDEESM